MKKNNFFKTPIKFYFISFYFFILIFIIYFFISNIVIVDKVQTEGILKDYINKSFVYSEYNGVVKDIFVKEGDFIKENEIIGTIDILDKNLQDREFKIEYLNNEDSSYELEALKKINTKRNIYSQKSGIVESLLIRSNEKINRNQNILKFNNKLEYFYLETFLTPEQIYDIKEKSLVYFNLKNQNKIYKGYIYKISNQKYSKEKILNYFNLKNKEGFKVDIIIIEQNKDFIEGMKVDISIIKGEKKLLSILQF